MITESPALDILADRAVGVAEAAAFLGYSKSQVRKLERLGVLPSLPRQCNRVTFDPKVLRAFRDGTLGPLKRIY
jgi:hypothetical protein